MIKMIYIKMICGKMANDAYLRTTIATANGRPMEMTQAIHNGMISHEVVKFTVYHVSPSATDLTPCELLLDYGKFMFSRETYTDRNSHNMTYYLLCRRYANIGTDSFGTLHCSFARLQVVAATRLAH